MDALNNVFVGEVLILHCHQNSDSQEPDDRHSDRSRYGSELLRSADISNQHAHAFRPNFIVAPLRHSGFFTGLTFFYF